jgi:phosphatidylserine/phosphatidylglycerophosphate/cardiolipin synthase-like enzyme
MKTTNFGTMLMVEDCESLVTPLPGQAFYQKLIESVNQAKFNIDVIQYQWNFYRNQPTNPVQKLNQALLNQLHNNKNVRCLLNKEGRGQHLTAINMKASQYLTEAGARCKFGFTFPIVHAKLWLIDDDITILGSHNLSGRSFTVNHEVSVLIKSKVVCAEFRRYFDSVWNLL